MQLTQTPHTTAQTRLELRARRFSTIRRRVAATLLASFGVAFGAIWQTGSIGAVATTTVSTAAVTRVASTTPVAATAAGTTAATTASTPPTTSTSSAAATPATVKTSQS